MCVALSSILALTEARKGGFVWKRLWDIAAIMKLWVMNFNGPGQGKNQCFISTSRLGDTKLLAQREVQGLIERT